jgi:hypothetical protein
MSIAILEEAKWSVLYTHLTAGPCLLVRLPLSSFCALRTSTLPPPTGCLVVSEAEWSNSRMTSSAPQPVCPLDRFPSLPLRELSHRSASSRRSCSRPWRAIPSVQMAPEPRWACIRTCLTASLPRRGTATYFSFARAAFSSSGLNPNGPGRLL